MSSTTPTRPRAARPARLLTMLATCLVGMLMLLPAASAAPANVMEALQDDGNYDTLVAMIDRAGLDTVLSDADTDFTVFAPRDDAWTSRGGWAQPIAEQWAQDNAPVGMLRRFLLAHVIVGHARDLDFFDEEDTTVVDAAAGYGLPFQQISVVRDGADTTIIPPQPVDGDPPIAVTHPDELAAPNGVVHGIDWFLSPRNHLSVLDQAGLSTLRTAMDTAGLSGPDSPLNVGFVPPDEGLGAVTGDYTLFGPTNAAFDALDDGVLDGLLADVPELTRTLQLHLVEGTYPLDELPHGTTLTSVLGEQLTITEDAGDKFVNGVRIATSDTNGHFAYNGVQHHLDGVLIPQPLPPKADPVATRVLSRQMASRTALKRCGAQRAQCRIVRGSRLGVRVRATPQGAVRGERVVFEYFRRDRTGWQMRGRRFRQLDARGQAQSIVSPGVGQWVVRVRLLGTDEVASSTANLQHVRILPRR